MATAEDSDSPVAMKLKKMWLKTPVSEEQAAQAVLDPAIGNYHLIIRSLNKNHIESLKSNYLNHYRLF